MLIAHVSDLHVLALDQVPLASLLRGKRLQGYANLTLKRRHQHDARIARRLLLDLRERRPDLVAITGDVSNLSLEQEFTAARRLIESSLQMSADRVMIVPGNHDAYTADAFHTRTFERVFADWLRSDEELDADLGDRPYPIARVRGDVAILGLTSAVPRGPFVASGEIGSWQLERLDRLLEHEQVRQRALLVLVHHPIAGMHGRLHVLLRGLVDADALVTRLAGRPRTLIVHGHLHRQVFHRLSGSARQLLVSGVRSASLAGSGPRRCAGYQLLEGSSEGWRIHEVTYDKHRDELASSLIGAS